MRARFVTFLLACSLGLMVCGFGRAETLEEAWATALAADQRLQAGQDRVSAASCNYVAAKRAAWPSLSHRTGYTFLTDDPSFAFAGTSFSFLDDNFAASATTAKMPLYTGGQIRNSAHAALAEVNANKENLRRSTLDIKLEVATAYTSILRARRAVEVAAANVESLRAHEKVIRTLLERGQVPKNDLLAAEVALADARQLGIQADNALATAEATYNRLLGRPLNQPVEIEEREVPPPSSDLEMLTTQALSLRPELAALASQANALRFQAESVRGNLRPKLGVEGGLLYLESPSIDPNTLGAFMFGLEWKPIDGGATRAKSNALEHSASAASRTRQYMISVIRLEVQTAWLAERETRQRLEVTAKAISQAEENLRAAKIRFQNGAAINTEVLDAESLRRRSYGNYHNSVYDAVLATFRLQRAVGTL